MQSYKPAIHGCSFLRLFDGRLVRKHNQWRANTLENLNLHWLRKLPGLADRATRLACSPNLSTHLSELPHLPRVSHVYVNGPLNDLYTVNWILPALW